MNEDVLSNHRKHIDQLDEKLIQLLAERFEITKAVGAFKAEKGLPAADPEREAEQIRRLHKIANEVGMDPEFSVKVFRLIVDEVIRHHEQTAEESSRK
ncbi:MAG: chorismate mutase [Acidimicrobiales bacterium]|nr:chorismate mutase [Acidimicrobiales bacterium]MDG1846545.1 chorismate mutase [Acidimicrobiales bacterium]